MSHRSVSAIGVGSVLAMLFVVSLVIVILRPSPASALTVASSATQSPSSYGSIRSVTWYEFGPTYAQSLVNLRAALPRIKDAGFNTVWLVTPWRDMQPQPLASPAVWNESNFTALKDTLAALRAKDMQAIIGLNYLGTGWAPAGIDACSWTSNSASYDAFVKYATGFLQRIDGYQDVANILVFTEAAEPCALNAYYDATEVMQTLRGTIGNLPSQLPSTLRTKWRIGYHDYSYINLGWGKGLSPIASPNPFDLVSMVAYELESKTDAEIKTEESTRAGRFKDLYPTMPLIIGEFGARSCSSSEDANQARVDSAILNYAIDHDMGANLWAWRPSISDADCDNHNISGYGLNIEKLDGTPRPAAYSIASILGGTVTLPSGSITLSPDPVKVCWVSTTGYVKLTASANVDAVVWINGQSKAQGGTPYF